MEESHEHGKSFKQENHLKSHQRSRAGEKPYHCSECGRSFRHSKTLKAHTCSRMEDGYSIAVVLEPDNSEKADLALVSSPHTCVPSFERRSPSPGVHSNLPPQTHQELPTEELLKSEEIKQENVEEPSEAEKQLSWLRPLLKRQREKKEQRYSKKKIHSSVHEVAAMHQTLFANSRLLCRLEEEKQELLCGLQGAVERFSSLYQLLFDA
ncbi:hypothetical protein MHYP_G00309560 [Metynnis hypsauchen]